MEATIDKDDQPNEFEELATINYVTVEEIEVAESYRNRVEMLIREHHPKSNVKTTIETKMTLKDRTPVHLHPRRLAPKEKNILNKQVEVGIIKPSHSEC